jgi:hypothetical protein
MEQRQREALLARVEQLERELDWRAECLTVMADRIARLRADGARDSRGVVDRDRLEAR